MRSVGYAYFLAVPNMDANVATACDRCNYTFLASDLEILTSISLKRTSDFLLPFLIEPVKVSATHFILNIIQLLP